MSIISTSHRACLCSSYIQPAASCFYSVHIIHGVFRYLDCSSQSKITSRNFNGLKTTLKTASFFLLFFRRIYNQPFKQTSCGYSQKNPLSLCFSCISSQDWSKSKALSEKPLSIHYLPITNADFAILVEIVSSPQEVSEWGGR